MNTTTPLRIKIRMTQYNPRPFIVKDAKKQEKWRMLAQQEPAIWDGRYGIKITKVHHGQD